jgi:hypothetical protein
MVQRTSGYHPQHIQRQQGQERWQKQEQTIVEDILNSDSFCVIYTYLPSLCIIV